MLRISGLQRCIASLSLGVLLSVGASAAPITYEFSGNFGINPDDNPKSFDLLFFVPGGGKATHSFQWANGKLFASPNVVVEGPDSDFVYNWSFTADIEAGSFSIGLEQVLISGVPGSEFPSFEGGPGGTIVRSRDNPNHFDWLGLNTGQSYNASFFFPDPIGGSFSFAPLALGGAPELSRAGAAVPAAMVLLSLLVVSHQRRYRQATP